MRQQFTIVVRGREGLVEVSASPFLASITVKSGGTTAHTSCEAKQHRVLQTAASLVNRIYHNAPREKHEPV